MTNQLEQEFPVPGGTLHVFIQQANRPSLIVGFTPEGTNGDMDTFGGTDHDGLHALHAAVANGQDITVTDPASGTMHAELIWNATMQKLTLKGAGETTDIILKGSHLRDLTKTLSLFTRAFP